MLVYFFTVILSGTSLLCLYNNLQLCSTTGCEKYTVKRCLFSIIVSLVVAGWGLKRKSLDYSGAIAGVFVGLVHTLGSCCFLACLFTFFYSSSKATHFRSDKKKKLESEFKEGGRRNWEQVVCNGGASTQMALLYLLWWGPGEMALDFQLDPQRSWLSAAVLASLAAANGDTWASEIASVLAKERPLLITSLTVVPVGTNGGFTRIGVYLSAAGGALVGLSYWLSLLLIQGSTFSHLLLVTSLGVAAGLFGSVLDSVIGATLQYSGLSGGRVVGSPGPGVVHISGRPCLSNHSVNLLMTLTSAIFLPSTCHLLS